MSQTGPATRSEDVLVVIGAGHADVTRILLQMNEEYKFKEPQSRDTGRVRTKSWAALLLSVIQCCSAPQGGRKVSAGSDAR